jgi:hypothetical protein
MAYDYTPFQDPASEIRLLKIHSATEHARLVTSISSFPIAKAPRYAAISYAWGLPLPVVPIFLNGTEVLVRQNCRYALWQSYLHNTELLIWIDSICINQDDLEEKNVQVRIMGKIFRKASLVLASVGPHGDDSVFLCGAIANFELRSSGPLWDNVMNGKPRKWQVERQPRRWVPWEIYRPPPPEAWTKHLDAFPHLGRVRVCAERFVQGRPYWSRLWVLQELTLAVEVFIMCGSELLLWSSLACFLKTLNYFPRDNYKIQHDFFHTVERFGYGKRKQPLDETSFFSNLAKLKCLDIRDRVFGTMTLVEWCDDADSIFPDYSMSVYRVALEVLRRGSGDTVPGTISLASHLIEFLRLTHDDIAAQAPLPLEQATALGTGLDSMSSLSSALETIAHQNQHVQKYLALPTYCELLQSKDLFSLKMNETRWALSTEILDIFEEVAIQEMKLHPGFPQLQRLVTNGATAGLLCSTAAPRDVVVSIDLAGCPESYQDLDLCLVFRAVWHPITTRSFMSPVFSHYAIVGPAVLGKGKAPLYRPYTPKDPLRGPTEGTIYLHPNDVFAQAARAQELRKEVQSNAYQAVMKFLTTPFTQGQNSSYFIPYPERAY